MDIVRWRLHSFILKGQPFFIMAKRFIDTSYYKSPFVRGLKGSLKSLYSFIICDCDGAGIWVKDLQIASTYIGFQITDKEFNDNFVKTKKAIDLQNGKYFFPDFLQHQYPKGLSIHNPAQKNFILELQKNLLIDGDLKPLWSTFEGTKVMVMEKVEVLDEEKVEVIYSKDLTLFEKKIVEFQKFRKEMKKPILDASKQQFLDKLMRLSGNNENTAILIINQSIANGWQGIFELKTESNGTITGKTNRTAETIANINSLLRPE